MQASDFIPNPLRILHLEDVPTDAELIERELAAQNLPAVITQVDNREGFTNALKQQDFHLIFADCSLPGYNGFAALRLAREEAPHIPFIFISGTLNGDLAMESIQQGATDYVLKDDLGRLVLVVRRALREVREQAARAEVAQELDRSQKELADFFEHAPIGLHWAGPDGCILRVNRAELDLFGYATSEYVGHHAAEFHEDPAVVYAALAGLAAGEVVPGYEARVRCRDGSIKTVLIETNALWENGELVRTRSFTRDITDRKRAEVRSAAFSKLGQRLSSVATPGEAAEIITQTADALLGWDACSLDLYVPERDILSPVLNLDLVAGKRVRVRAPYADAAPSPLAVRILREGGKLILREGSPALSPDLVPFGDESRPSASLMFVPIRHGAKNIGILSIQSYRPNAYTLDDLNTLQALSDHCGGALERIHAEEALTRLAAIVKSSSEAIIGKTLDGIITSWNAGAEKVFGYTAAEARGAAITMLLPPDRLEEEAGILEMVKRGETVSPFETVRRRKDGRLIDISATISPIRDAAGKVIGASKIAHDITERKQAEVALQRTEDLYRRAISGVGAVPYQYDYVSRSYMFMGGGIVRLTGYTPDEIKPDFWQQITKYSTMLGESAGLTKAEAVQCARMGEIRYWRCDSLITTKRGELRWISDTSVPNRDESGKPIGSIGILQDITERKEGEKALRESEERFRRVVESDMMGIMFWEGDGRIVDANDKFLALVGYTRQDLADGLLNSGKMTTPEYLELDQANQEMMRLHGFCPPVEKEYFRKDGTRIPVLVGSTNLPGAVEKGVSFVLDISQRTSAEEALRASENHYRLLFENNPTPVFVFDAEALGFLAANAAAVRHYGYTREDFSSLTLREIALPEEIPAFLEKISRPLAEVGGNTGIWRHRKKGGKLSEMEITTHPLVFDGRRAFLSLAIDVTERLSLEAQLRQSQKMESVGQLAGGIAHDFNNLLTVISGHVGLLLAKEKFAPQIADSLKEISEASKRAADLTRQLLMFSRKQIIQLQVVDLNEVVNNVGKMLRRILGEDISLDVDYSPSLPCIKADLGMIEQVLLNLAVNSRDAMPKGGQLRINTTSVIVDEIHAQQNPEAVTGRFVQLTFADNGCGIPAENLSRIFEPFFTTKELDRGTGLGLATVYGIVRQHQGWIEVTSELDHGTTFNVFLPPTSEKSGAVSMPVGEPRVIGGTETILVVEDEAPLLKLIQHILESHGYKVIECSNGRTALELWGEHRKKIDLLFTDMILPDGMTGPELAEILQVAKPGLKVIYTSGYNTEKLSHDVPLQEGLNFIQKPFHARKLAETVHDCLNAKLTDPGKQRD